MNFPSFFQLPFPRKERAWALKKKEKKGFFLMGKIVKPVANQNAPKEKHPNN